MDRSSSAAAGLVWFWILFQTTGNVLAATLAPFHDSNFAPDRDVIVHLFEWRWPDIADECERFLGPMKYAGVQVSPPNENAVVFHPPFNQILERPWFERYQPVSYKLVTRSGNEKEFADMVQRCNNAGIRIYVDAVINHMTGDYPEGSVGTAGNVFDSENLHYDAVPYGPSDFHNKTTCPSYSGNIEDYSSSKQVRNCELVNLKDLNQTVENVRHCLADYMNHLLKLGVAGFRVDAVKHMWPEDLKAIYARLDNLDPVIFGPNERPLIYQEVIDMGGEGIGANEYSDLGRVTEFKYGMRLGNIFRGRDQMRYLSNFGEAWGFLKSEDALVFIDNHDNQRGHGGGGAGTILTFTEPRLYQMATAFLLAWPFGLKQMMSSFRWEKNFVHDEDQNNWMGPPHDAEFNTLPVTINDEGQCEGDWVCEHRWPIMTQMVRFSVVASNLPMTNWWDNGANQIAFSRGNRAFFALNNEYSTNMETRVQSGLACGRYCDVTTGALVDGKCTGRIVTVNRKSQIYVSLPCQGESMLALHAEAMVEDFSDTYMQQTTTYATPSTDYKRTIILIEKQTKLGEYLFICGGISPENRQICYNQPESCKIPITYTKGNRTPDYFQEWQKNDEKLDWGGPAEGQGKFKTTEASGSPLFWTTNDSDDVNYNEFNTFGPNYWVFDVEMDCSKTHYGWFEFKVRQANDNWEPNIYQNGQCEGKTYSAQKPFASTNHVAMCGKLNVFHYGDNGCSINDF